MSVSAHQIFDKLAKLLNSIVQMSFDCQNMLVQTVIPITSVTSTDILNRQA